MAPPREKPPTPRRQSVPRIGGALGDFPRPGRKRADDTAAVARIKADVQAGLDERESVEREARRLVAEDEARSGRSRSKRVLTLASALERITRAILPDRLYREAYKQAGGDRDKAVKYIVDRLAHDKKRQRDAAAGALKRCFDELKNGAKP